MADAAKLMSDMNHVISLQKYIPGVLTGFYLTDDDATSISSKLTDNQPVKNSIGRYRGVPVYTNAHLSVAMQRDNGQYENVVYTFVSMLAVD